VTGVVDADTGGLRLEEEDRRPEDTEAVSLNMKKALSSSSVAQWEYM
jgi:hypothetical protein